MDIAKILIIVVIMLMIFIISVCLYGIIRFYANKEQYDTQQLAAEHIFNDIYNNKRHRSSSIVKQTPHDIIEENPQLVKNEIPKIRRDFIMV